MDINKYLILINDVNKTEEIESFDVNKNKVDIVFKSNNTKYQYSLDKVKIIENPTEVNINSCIVFSNEKQLFKISKILDFRSHLKVFFEDGSYRLYDKKHIKIEKNSLNNNRVNSVLEYLKSLAERLNNTDDKEEVGFLDKQYKKMTFISEDSVLSKYLSSGIIDTFENKSTIIFPFGFNLSQEKAVKNALTNQISIIEGPPGTGKTQTILNILSNIIMREKTVAIVSNNNAATKNVYDKLSSYDLSFISAFLGNKDNQEEFFNNQDTSYPNFVSEKTEVDFKKLYQEVSQDSKSLKEMLSTQNELALQKQLYEEFKVEKKHFLDYYEKKDKNIEYFKTFKKYDIDSILSLLAEFENIQLLNKKITLLFKIKNLIKYRLFSFSIYKYPINSIIECLQSLFYENKEIEITKQINTFENKLSNFDFENKMKLYTQKSMFLLKRFISNKYKFANKRTSFNSDVLWKDFRSFIEEYPIVLSTTHSLRNSTGNSYLYDYLIIDESSQVDVLSGSLALSCAKNVVIVGDLKQLPHVITNETKDLIQIVYNQYKVDEAYHYNNNLLLSITKIFKDVPKTLLKEHYRCNPKIIGFCNKKFYNNELIVLTKFKNENESPLVLFNTAEGNHARGKYNQRQIDVITNEILPNLNDSSIGIISPFRKQVNKINEEYNNNKEIEVDTVHKYQGREKNIIILSTVVNDEDEFADDKNLLNVAISRAVDKLYVVVSDREKNQNMKDLVGYIKYYNCDIVESKIYSIFDLLYKSYSSHLNKYQKKYKSVSEHKSENLMSLMIDEVLKEDDFLHLDVVLHRQLRVIIKDFSLLNEEETKFVNNENTHIDFLIYSKINKQIVLAIEVDGYKYHEDSPIQKKRDKLKDEILEKYNIPIIRFATNASQESKKLKECLKKLV
ncbi:AAA domain-containing protein [Aliarcobacter butzleri]|uniref:AAA domain-containing protein n=1 Tax=Aliarcobacter butzleri TaxID=28197 RepID=UPI001EDB2EFD|nr:AAA domain-containing protein [Aliarcobacter butzleri]MCG3650680.1 AAA domain-containing protein [Aliarcobacter butzleri]